MQCASESMSTDTHVHDSRTMVAVVLVESEFLSCVYTVDEVCILRLRIRKLIDEVLNMRNCALEALVNLSERTLDIRYLALALEALALKNDLAAVSICVSDASPDTDCIRVLLRSVDLDVVVTRKPGYSAQDVRVAIENAFADYVYSIPMGERFYLSALGKYLLDTGCIENYVYDSSMTDLGATAATCFMPGNVILGVSE